MAIHLFQPSLTSSNALKHQESISLTRLSNIFDDLVSNRSFLSYNKFQSYKERLVEIFANTSPHITLRDTLRQIL